MTSALNNIIGLWCVICLFIVSLAQLLSLWRSSCRLHASFTARASIRWMRVFAVLPRRKAVMFPRLWFAIHIFRHSESARFRSAFHSAIIGAAIDVSLLSSVRNEPEWSLTDVLLWIRCSQRCWCAAIPMPNEKRARWLCSFAPRSPPTCSVFVCVRPRNYCLGTHILFIHNAPAERALACACVGKRKRKAVCVAWGDSVRACWNVLATIWAVDFFPLLSSLGAAAFFTLADVYVSVSPTAKLCTKTIFLFDW